MTPILLDRGLTKKAFSQSLKRPPALRQTYSFMLLAKTPKWGGDENDMFAFAREHAEHAPPESGAAVLPVEAHFHTFEQIDPFTPERAQYWRRPAVRDEVLVANDRCTRGGLAGMNGVRNRHWLAYALWRAGEFTMAHEHFKHLGAARPEAPWGGMRAGFNWLFSPLKRARRESRKAAAAG